MPYSAFFSSGLLAPHHNQCRAHTPVPPSSPTLIPSSPGESADVDRSTPTPSNPADFDMQTTPNAAHLNVPTSERPRLRRRRSSVTVGVSPMTAIKSPTRNAGAALHRAMNGTMSPNRSRSGSVNSDVFGALQVQSIAGRMRSANNGINLRPRRTIRKAPSAPPPTSPLPDVPALEALSPTLGFLSAAPVHTASSFPMAYDPYSSKPASRSPLMRRMHSAVNNCANVNDNVTPSMTPDFAAKVATTPDQGLTDGPLDAVYRIDEEMKEN